ncbi:MAG: UbiD family decarboxylase [Methyloligellaceae bacterium]
MLFDLFRIVKIIGFKNNYLWAEPKFTGERTINKSDNASETSAIVDFQTHLENLKQRGLVQQIDREINKDTELHPLVRWQYRGGIPESRRKAFLFTNVVDGSGYRYDIPVIVGALAATPEIYTIGMGVPAEQIGEKWMAAIDNPLPSQRIAEAPCQEVVITGDELKDMRGGLGRLPIPISTPGFDAAPYFTATLCITKDPETGIRNMGTYRAAPKAPNRLGVRMASRIGGAGGYLHWLKYKERGERMPCVIVIGAPPAVAFTGPQKLKIDQDEMGVAGALIGTPVRVCQAATVDLEIPADAEIVIEGLVDTELLEPEGPFGESHGYVALEDFNMSMEVTAITHKSKPVFASIISQVTPSESSVIKKVAYEPLYLQHLRDHLNVKGIKRVVMHEPLTNIRKLLFLQFAPGTPRDEVWRGLKGASTLQSAIGKLVIAVSEDIDPLNPDAIFWSMAYRCNPAEDVQISNFRAPGHGPKSERAGFDSTMLIDATLKHVLPPLALPRKEFMENAREIWEELELPELNPESPWHGYELGDWESLWTQFAENATQGRWMENGKNTYKRRKPDIKPETPVRKVPGTEKDFT